VRVRNVDDCVIRAEGLSKKYLIGHRQRDRYPTFKDALTSSVKSLGRPFRRSTPKPPSLTTEELWALKGISFQVRQGERVGIIGRNGAGKSTLLKILSRVTDPTEGRVSLKGRVGSLLEVGTGFHPELTGRENVYLNGAILGMSKPEIERKFDEIVAFSEVEKFLDTPVKRYSSGMYVRLAFAVAAHLDPEILIMDEVLAVGDTQFQKKCLGKMGEVTREGRTVLFVSHSMTAVQSLCSRVVWLHDGQIKGEGKPADIISDYLQSNAVLQTAQVWDDPDKAPGNDTVRLHRIDVRPQDPHEVDSITMQTPVEIDIEYWNLVPNARLHITLHVYTEQQIVAFSTGSCFEPIWGRRSLPKGLFRSSCFIPGNLLNSGVHRVSLLVVQDGDTVIYQHPDIISFDVSDPGKREGVWFGKEPGAVFPALQWTTEYLDGKCT
jgi:lipopolysaccharide transport system ATP-binding protein